MAEKDKTPATFEELLISSVAAADAVAKLLIEKGIITEKEFYDKLSVEGGLYQRILATTLEENSDLCNRNALFENSVPGQVEIWKPGTTEIWNYTYYFLDPSILLVLLVLW
jgi:hypothetical protein